MSELAWIFVAYGLVGIAVARIVAGHIAYSSRSEPDGEDWTFGGMGGVLLGTIWPLTLFCWSLRHLPIMSQHERKARVDAERKKRERAARGY